MIERLPSRRRRAAAAPAFPRAILALAILALGALAPASFAHAQAAAPVATQEQDAQLPSAAELEALAATLADEAKRKELLTTIRGLIQARQAAERQQPQNFSERLVAAAEASAASGKEVVESVMTEIGGMPGVIDWFGGLRRDPQARGRLLRQLGFLTVILVAGWTAEVAIWWSLSAARRRLSRPGQAGMMRRAFLLVALALVDLVPLAGFAAGSYGAFVFARPHLPGSQVGQVGLQILMAYIAARALLAIARMVFAPGRPDVRMLPAGDETANYLYVWARRFVNVTVFGYFVVEAAMRLGMPQRGAEGLARLIGVIPTLLVVIFILQNRTTVADWLRSEDGEQPRILSTAPLRRGVAALWHILAIVYTVALFVVWAWEIDGGFSLLMRATVLSAAIAAVAMGVIYGLRRMIDSGLGVTEDQHLHYPRLKARANRYLPYVYAALKVIVVFVAALAMLDVWGIDVFGWMSRPFGSRVIGSVVSIAIVAAVAIVVWEMAGIVIERRLEASEGETVSPEHAARVRTLLPLMRKALLAALSVIVVLIVLAELGVNIGPLLAGAGVVGLAIGFGAQTLVKDVITGAFMLIEDALAVGDVVTVAGIGGLVEGLSIRSIRLRDLSGNVHTIPFSTVDTVTNMTKDFSYYLLDIGVAYREDTDEVARVCTEIVEEMRTEADYAPLILEPLEVLGVDQFTDSAVILKARIKTRPIKQWLVGREFNRRMKKRFDERGIEIPFPHRTLYFGADKDGSAPPAHVSFDRARAAAAADGAAGKPAGEGKPTPAERKVKYVAVDLPDPHPDAGATGGHHGDDSEVR